MSPFHTSSADEVKELEKFERRKAAIETIFTLAILYAASVQILVSSGWSVDPLSSLIPVVVLLLPALLLGGRNLIEQLGEATGFWSLQT